MGDDNLWDGYMFKRNTNFRDVSHEIDADINNIYKSFTKAARFV